MSNLLNVKEICEYLKVTRQTITRWRANDGMPYKKINNAVRFDLEEVKFWVENKQK